MSRTIGNWRTRFVWWPRRCVQLQDNGFFASDGWGWLCRMWCRTTIYGERWCARRHPLTDELP